MHVPGLHPDLLNQKFYKWVPAIRVLTSLPGDSEACPGWGTAASEPWFSTAAAGKKHLEDFLNTDIWIQPPQQF